MFRNTVSWILILTTWIVTPFLNDRTSAVLLGLYIVLLVVMGIYGSITAIKNKSWILLGMTVVTLFAWPILLFIFFSLFGIN